MKWEREFVDMTGYRTQVLRLEQSELAVLQKVLLPHLKKTRAKYEKYRAIHDSGEATEKEDDMFFEAMDELSVLESFCKQ